VREFSQNDKKDKKMSKKVILYKRARMREKPVYKRVKSRARKFENHNKKNTGGG
jgi:ribosomal protein S17